MSEYIYSKNNAKLIELRNNLYKFDPSEASKTKIDAFNRMDFSSKLAFKRLFRPVKRRISCTSYIIPVNKTTSVTGYLFQRTVKRASDPSSLIIYIHEGGWTIGNPDITSAICSNICERTGAMVLAVDYRLAPNFKFPSPVEDCYKAFLWAEAGAKYWKADPAKIYLMGTSCGAGIAASVCQIARDQKGPKPAGQILIDPLTDCRLRTTSLERFKNNPVLTVKQLKRFIENYQNEPKDILDPMFSPLLSKDLSRLPDALILSAEFDILSDDAKYYAKALEDADSNVRLFVREGAAHGTLSYPKSDDWSKYMDLIADFVKDTALKNLKLR